MKGVVTAIALLSLNTTSVFAIDCAINQGREVVYDLAQSPNGKQYLPDVERQEFMPPKVRAFSLRIVSEKCSKASTSDTFSLEGFPGVYRHQSEILILISALKDIRLQGLKSPDDLVAALNYVNQTEEASKVADANKK